MVFRMLFAVFVTFGAFIGDAAAYDKAEYEWCYNNLPRFYDENFQACVDRNCDRISNKKITQKRACYRRCTGDVVEACKAQRATDKASPAVKQAASAPVPGAAHAEQGITTSSPSLQSIASRPAETEAAPEQVPAEGKREDGFLSRMWRGFGGGAEPAQASAPQDAPGEGEGEGKRKGFLAQLADSFGEGAGNLNADYKWCRDNSGGYFQDLMNDCTRGCMAGPSASGSRRQACIRTCKVNSVDACIARRDGK
ncbi:MAG: hypothetical protein RIB80_12585 [Rhodospirillales bacterium]